MSESVATIPAVARIGEAGATRGSARPESIRGTPKLAAVLMALIVALTVCASSWVYYEGAQILKCHQQMKSHTASVASRSEAEFLARVGRWQLAMTLVMAGGGLLLVLIAANGFRSRQQKWSERLAQSAEEWKRQVNDLRTQLVTQSQVAGDLRREQEAERQKARDQITELSRANAALNDELEQRRRAEKSLAQQRQELARSKDVLELHVQARTQELQKLQRRSELILNSAAEGICGFDLQGKITFANPAAARVMGLEVAQMIGQPEASLFPVFKSKVAPDTVGTNRQSPSWEGSGVGQQPIEVVAPRPDGSTFAAEYLRSPIHEPRKLSGENDHLVGEVLIFKDISERKQAAETLAQRLAELARSNAELEQFAFVASHDLQEPLRKIQAFGDRLKAKCDEAKLEQGRDYLERMQKAAARMQTLINDLLTFSRVISRAEPFTLVDLGAVTREVLGDLEVRIEKSQAKVEVGELPKIEGDAVQIRQLLQNLVGNALKFQPPDATPVVQIQGRVVMQPSARGHQAIFTRQSADGGEVSLGEEFCQLTVQDNGIGLDEKHFDKIFAVFARLHGRQEYEGTGIGLAVCRRIVDRHGGTISVCSQPGQGATFTVCLPLKQTRKLSGDTSPLSPDASHLTPDR